MFKIEHEHKTSSVEDFGGLYMLEIIKEMGSCLLTMLQNQEMP